MAEIRLHDRKSEQEWARVSESKKKYSKVLSKVDFQFRKPIE